MRRIAVSLILGGSLAAGCAVGSIEGGTPDESNVPQPAEKVVPRIGLRRLTSYEYDNTVRDLLGDTSRKSALVLPEDPRTPFDNDYDKQAPSKALVEGLELLARDASRALVTDAARREKVLGCTPTGPADSACFTTFVKKFGRRALRRPLSGEEVTRFLAFQSFATEANDFYAGVETALLAFLQHAEFVYRVEIGTPVANRSDTVRLNDFELATRLSYFVVATTPDDTLLDAAESGALADPAGVQAQAARLLADERGRATVQRFHALWLGYDKIIDNNALSKDMLQESRALVDRVLFEQHRPWEELFTSTETYATDSLATHYGLAGTGSAAPTWISYGDSGRKGILSHGVVLTNGAKLEDTSPTLRGLFVRVRLMCQDIPPPPPTVNTDLPPLEPGQCKIERLAKTHAQGGCAACHSKMDPIGFGLEQFDQQGRFRTTEPGKPTCPIDGQGELAGVSKFKGPSELADLLVRDGAVQACAAKQLYRFAIGRSKLDPDDERFIEWWLGKLGGAKAGLKFDQLLVEFVAADGFRHRRLTGKE